MTLFINLKRFDLGQDLKVEPEFLRYQFFTRHDQMRRTLNTFFFLTTFMYRRMLSDAKKTHLTLWVS